MKKIRFLSLPTLILTAWAALPQPVPAQSIDEESIKHVQSSQNAQTRTLEHQEQKNTEVYKFPTMISLSDILGCNYQHNINNNFNNSLLMRDCALDTNNQQQAIVKKKSLLDYKFWSLAAGLTASTIYDAEITFAVLGNTFEKDGKLYRVKERNSLMRPFVDSGRPATYAVQMAINTGIMYGAYELRKRGYKGWWLLPPISIIAIHGAAGSLNLRFK